MNMAEQVFVDMILKALVACHEDAKGRHEYAGSIECPACGGTLKYLTAYKGATRHRVVGKCDTEECLHWQ